MSQQVKEVLQKLSVVDPETFKEFRALISDVGIMNSELVNAGTCLPAFGMISLRTLRAEQNWTAYLEHLVHESAHHYLYAVWTTEDLILNEDTARYKSPLRTEPRPLSGIYHAMFVLARTIRAIRLFQRCGEYGPEIRHVATQYNNAKNPASFEDKFCEAAEVIEQNAALSSLGGSIYGSCRQMINL